MDRTYLKTLVVDFIAQQREASTCAVVAHLEAHGTHLPWAAVREILDDFEINDKIIGFNQQTFTWSIVNA